MAVVMMLCYARSGGTLLNRCLGSLPRMVVLSEVNPLGGGWGQRGPDSYTTPQAQAHHWYGIDLKSEGFSESILELEKICAVHGRHLIVRDWSFINFTPHRCNEHTPPNRFLTLEALQGKTEVRAFAFVRDAIDVWLSRGVPMSEFFPAYLRYVQALRGLDVPIFKYEAFCQDPDREMQQLCREIGVPFSNAYRNYRLFTKVNGDTQIRSRGSEQEKIRVLPRRTLDQSKIRKLDRNSLMIEANHLMGYPTAYRKKGISWLLYRMGRFFPWESKD